MAIVISGSSGFVGQAFIRRLARKPSRLKDGVVALNRQSAKQAIEQVHYPIIEGQWTAQALANHINAGDCVVHLAGRAHQGSDCPQEETRLQLESHLTLSQNLAKAVFQQNAKRFIYISSAKVFAQHSKDKAFDARSTPTPEDPYGKAKWQTEQWLQSFCKQHAIELIILRPGLIYDLHAKGNIARLQRLIHSGLPLPFASLKNRRDMISLANFCDLIEHCVSCPVPDNNVCIATDGQSMSSTEFLNLLAQAQGLKARQFALAHWLEALLCKLPAFNKQWQTLKSNFALDNRACNIAIGWHAPYTPMQSLKEHSYSNPRKTEAETAAETKTEKGTENETKIETPIEANND